MRINSAIRALFGIAAAVGAAAGSLPAGAETVTLHDDTGLGSQTVSGTIPSITISGSTVACNISFSITFAPGISVGTAYPTPVFLGIVTAASLTAGSPYCTSVTEYAGSAPAASVSGNTVLSSSNPWRIQVTSASATSQTTAATIQDVILYTPAFGYCYGSITGTYSTSSAATNPNTLAIPSQTLTHATSSGIASGTCTINSGVLLAVSPSGSLSIP